MPTKIDWCDEVWNPVTGCSKISPGCEHCYAERMAKRLAGRCGYPKRNPFRVTVHENRMELPMRWRKPRRIFVNSMGDLFHPAVPANIIRDIWHVMSANPHHTFLVLTKRPYIMLEWMRVVFVQDHIWLGVTVEDQQAVYDRIPPLLQIPATRRFVSIEPMLEPVKIPNLDKIFRHVVGDFRLPPHSFPNRIDWVICGGETGPRARPMRAEWVRDLRDQCVDADVPFFFKGWGTALRPKDETYQLIEGKEWKEFPK